MLSPLPFAAGSVALGAAYMRMAGAPLRYILINFAALAVGLLIALLIRKARPSPQLAGLLAALVALVLLTTTLRGPSIDGASRWIPVASISVQPSLMLLPAAIVLFARNPSWLSAIGLAVAALALALQPDRAMAGALTAALAVLWLYRRDALVTLTLAVASCGFAATLVRADQVPPVPFVERVVQSAFAFNAFAGTAVVIALALLLIPAMVGVRARKEDEAVFAVFGATWLAVITFAIIGNYPTPLAGYGASSIVGYCLSSGLLAGGDHAGHSCRPRGRAATIIALTGWGQDCDREQSRDAGCNGHLVKPVALDELNRVLASRH
jgi:hypothetical protein